MNADEVSLLMTAVPEPARVLIVDDDPMARETLEAVLRKEGYTLLFAASGNELFQQMAAAAPDLILLDVMMPDIHGFDICLRLKASAHYRHIPIILVTALDSTADLVRGLDSGADEFISKPFRSPELRARVRTMLRIKRQYDALQYMLQTRDLLSNMIVHDMRNPLAAVMLYIQLLRRRGNLQSEQERYLEMIFNEAQHVSAFLEDMLLLNKLDRGPLTLTRSPLELSRLFAEVHQKTNSLAVTRKVTVESTEPPVVEGLEVDLVLFQRALENMLTHAIKSAPPHTAVTVSAQVHPDSNSDAPAPRLRIEVTNAGAHLPPEDLERLFDKFAVMTLKEQGSSHVGLGLAYCRMVVEAHGGHAFATNIEPRGLRFIIELP
ncbi:MAG: hybrid sensor histidine kinase/response regulator [Chloroflexi bacterium]|nr:MAG: hybrid sensor histidine kinase/response regulator [Chloroflexota bacterium]